jgi:hypothetical protein
VLDGAPEVGVALDTQTFEQADAVLVGLGDGVAGVAADGLDHALRG